MSTFTLKRTTSADPAFQLLIKQLDADLRLRNGEIMDVYDQHNIIEPIATVIIAYAEDEPIGCGCFKSYDAETVEIKRMFVIPEYRGKGVSRAMLNALEQWAKEQGYTYTVLETGSKQEEALSLYAKAGYKPISKYGPYVDLPDSYCFRKEL